MITDQDIVFAIYDHWPRYSFSGTWFMLSDGKKHSQYKCRPHRGHHQKILEQHLSLGFFRQFGSCFGFFDIAG
jgi:hypothetical protein